MSNNLDHFRGCLACESERLAQIMPLNRGWQGNIEEGPHTCAKAEDRQIIDMVLEGTAQGAVLNGMRTDNEAVKVLRAALTEAEHLSGYDDRKAFSVLAEAVSEYLSTKYE
ncbi:hypothetical protein F0P96_10685 [Hymenobacter busanensis]|uniref:Uncharacterized protein n=1 Tax=Hymenobacter busanensis TaxID=2607656 RepID=A0A7L5A0G2_9BACT|nr:hypothetical protein [Hymenobacter busanensis]KAA9333427.1 hypothetical protein F0P96_10685 [Hymenobacter busanensis]QHJ07892.1 hypothetical protein GUY19_11615 [Hymenobacter busanensis]